MGALTDSTIALNEANAREGHLVAAPWGYFLINGSSEPEPILAWRIGNAECDAVLPVTACGTQGSLTYVLRPDGKVVWHGVHYYSEMPDYPDLASYREAEREAEKLTIDHNPFRAMYEGEKCRNPFIKVEKTGNDPSILLREGPLSKRRRPH